jgi:GT2 family glycosyltransferase
MTLSDRLTIGITTRNRWRELEDTLAVLKGCQFDKVPVVIVDDASSDSWSGFPQMMSNMRLIRSDIQSGLVAQRNRLATLATTDYLLSLDDDSYVTEPHQIARVIEYLDEHPTVAVAALHVVEPGPPGRPVAGESFGGAAQDCRSFVGCGHILRLSTFRSLGGYRADLFYTCEEIEYSLRLWKSGYRVIIFPEIAVYHSKTAVSRPLRTNAWYSSRNAVLCWLLHAPWVFLPPLLGRVIARRLVYGAKSGNLWPCLAGLWEGLRQAPEMFRAGRPGVLTPAQFSSWQRLPDPLVTSMPIPVMKKALTNQLPNECQSPV